MPCLPEDHVAPGCRVGTMQAGGGNKMLWVYHDGKTETLNQETTTDNKKQF